MNTFIQLPFQSRYRTFPSSQNVFHPPLQLNSPPWPRNTDVLSVLKFSTNGMESYGMYSFVNSFLAFFSLSMFLRFIHVCNLLFPFKKILGIHLCSHSYLQFLFIYHSVPEHKYVFKWKFSIPYFKKITLLYSCTCLLVHMQKLISVW